jgi:uncharacterized protein (DUF433 family)
MAFTIQSDPSPLRIDDHGVARVGDSQVLLDVVIREYNNGAEPEAIAHGYPTLNLADVHGVIAYYLRHRKEIDDYLHAPPAGGGQAAPRDRGQAAQLVGIARETRGSQGPDGPSSCFVC